MKFKIWDFQLKMDLKIQFKTVSSQKKKQLEEESVQLYTGSNTGIASPIVGLKAYKIIEEDMEDTKSFSNICMIWGVGLWN